MSGANGMRIGQSYGIDYKTVRYAHELPLRAIATCSRCQARIQREIDEERHSPFEAAPTTSMQRSPDAVALSELRDRMDRHICLPWHLADLRKRIDYNATENEQLEALMNAIGERLAAK